MIIDVILQAIYDWPLSQAIREGSSLFPTIEALHVVAIATVLGTICILDLRLVGVAAHTRSIARLSRELLPVTWGAFMLAVVCGGLLFISNAVVYFGNTNFRAKMALMALAGLNMVVFHFVTQRNFRDWDEAEVPPAAARLAGLLSLLLWAGVVFFGRRVGFTLR